MLSISKTTSNSLELFPPALTYLNVNLGKYNVLKSISWNPNSRIKDSLLIFFIRKGISVLILSII